MKKLDTFEFFKANKNCDECDHENEYVCFDCEREQVKEKYPNAKYSIENSMMSYRWEIEEQKNV